MNILAVDCCIRGEESRTKRLLDAFLEKYADAQFDRLVLADENLTPLDAAALRERDSLLAEKNYSHTSLRHAHQFRDADMIVIAAPYWDLSFPSLLKVYLERITVSGVTFGYTESGESVGFCRAKELVYLSTCGGFTGERHLGAEYVKALSEMLGVERFSSYAIEGLDIEPGKAESLMNEGIEHILSQRK